MMEHKQHKSPAALLAEGIERGKAGELEKAADLMMAAAEINPEDIDFLIEVGSALEGIKRFGKAYELYLERLKKDPENYILLARLGGIYLEVENPRLAVEFLEKARDINPDDPGVLNNLGMAYRHNKELDKAIDTLKLALQKGGPMSLILGTLAGLLESTNQLEELDALIADALVKHPKDGYLLYIAAKRDRRNNQPENALEKLNRVKASENANEVQILYNFEMARVYEQLGDLDQAMRYFEVGNNYIKQEPEYLKIDPKAALRYVDAMRAIELKKWANISAGPMAAPLQEPAFLVGFPRSGTTLLHQILDGHPGIEVFEEQPYINLLRLKIQNTMGGYPEGLLTMSEAQFTSLRDEYIEAVTHFATKQGAVKVVDKLPLNIIDLPLVLKLFPRAKIILALRHPCDCVLSCFMQNFSINNSMIQFLSLDDSSAFYTRIMGLWQYYTEHLEIDFHIVKYENVIAGLETEARALVDFLGLPWNQEVLNYREQAKAKEYINTPSYHQVIKPLYTDAQDRWRRYRTYMEPYLERLGPFIKAFEYDP